MALGLDPNIILAGMTKVDPADQNPLTVENKVLGLQQQKQNLQTGAIKQQQDQIDLSNAQSDQSDSMKANQVARSIPADDPDYENKYLKGLADAGVSSKYLQAYKKSMLADEGQRLDNEYRGVQIAEAHQKQIDNNPLAAAKQAQTVLKAQSVLDDIWSTYQHHDAQAGKGGADLDRQERQATIALNSSIDDSVAAGTLTPQQAAQQRQKLFPGGKLDPKTGQYSGGRLDWQAVDDVRQQMDIAGARIKAQQQDATDKAAEQHAKTQKEQIDARTEGPLRQAQIEKDRAAAQKTKNQQAGLEYTPEGRQLFNDVVSHDQTGLRGLTGKDRVTYFNDAAREGKTWQEIITDRAQSQGEKTEATQLYKQKASIEKTEESIVSKGGFLDQAEDAVKAVDMPSLKKAAEAKNFALDQVSDPKLTAYAGRVTELRQEYALVLSKGGVPTDANRREAEKVVPDIITPAQFKEIRQTITNGVKTSRKAIDKSIANLGKPSSDDDASSSSSQPPPGFTIVK